MSTSAVYHRQFRFVLLSNAPTRVLNRRQHESNVGNFITHSFQERLLLVSLPLLPFLRFAPLHGDVLVRVELALSIEELLSTFLQRQHAFQGGHRTPQHVQYHPCVQIMQDPGSSGGGRGALTPTPSQEVLEAPTPCGRERGR